MTFVDSFNAARFIVLTALSACGGLASASHDDAGGRDGQTDDATAVGDHGDAGARRDDSGETPDGSVVLDCPAPYPEYVCAGGLCGILHGQNFTCDCGACPNAEDFCGDQDQNKCGHVCMALEPPDSGKAAALCGCTMTGPQCPWVPNWVVDQACVGSIWFGYGSSRVVYPVYVAQGDSCFFSANGYRCCQ